MHGALLGGLAGAVVVLLEALAPSHPLDMQGTTPEAIGWTVGLFALLAGVDLRLLLVLWPVLAWTEGAHAAGGSPMVWGLGALPFVAGALRIPRWCLGLLPLLALVVPLARPGAVPVETQDRAGEAAGLLLITVDTVRADAKLLQQAIAEPEAWWIGTATTAAPWTPPAMTSLWLGLPVDAHGGGIELDGRITWPRGVGFEGSFPAHWQRTGRRVDAIVSNPYLRAKSGFATGTTHFWHTGDAREPHLLLHTLRSTWARLSHADTRVGHTRDARQVAFAEQRLRAHTADLTWVHLLEPHEYTRRGGEPHAAYARGIQQTAGHIRRLIAAAGERTIVIVGDHGENLGEHGVWGHGRHLTPEVLTVPLAIRAQSPPAVERWTIPQLGHYLRTLATREALEPAPASVSIAGLRGPDALKRWLWSPDTHTASPASGAVVPGPLQAAPDAATHAALQALGYLDP